MPGAQRCKALPAPRHLPFLARGRFSGLCPGGRAWVGLAGSKAPSPPCSAPSGAGGLCGMEAPGGGAMLSQQAGCQEPLPQPGERGFGAGPCWICPLGQAGTPSATASATPVTTGVQQTSGSPGPCSCGVPEGAGARRGVNEWGRAWASPVTLWVAPRVQGGFRALAHRPLSLSAAGKARPRWRRCWSPACAACAWVSAAGRAARGGPSAPPTHTHRAAAVPNATPWAADAAEPPLRP